MSLAFLILCSAMAGPLAFTDLLCAHISPRILISTGTASTSSSSPSPLLCQREPPCSPRGGCMARFLRELFTLQHVSLVLSEVFQHYSWNRFQLSFPKPLFLHAQMFGNLHGSFKGLIKLEVYFKRRSYQILPSFSFSSSWPNIYLNIFIYKDLLECFYLEIEVPCFKWQAVFPFLRGLSPYIHRNNDLQYPGPTSISGGQKTEGQRLQSGVPLLSPSSQLKHFHPSCCSGPKAWSNPDSPVFSLSHI